MQLNRRVHPLPAVEDFDLLEDAGAYLVVRRVALAIARLLLQYRKEALAHSVVAAVAPAANARHRSAVTQLPSAYTNHLQTRLQIFGAR